jgi:hypothetical protein
MLPEQFIQDAVCHPRRLEKILRDPLINKPLTFVDGTDVINQEFSFAVERVAGRVDVLATLDSLRHLVIIEVKDGVATNSDVEQLKWYLDHWSYLTQCDPRLAAVQHEDVLAMVLAEDLADVTIDDPRIRFVTFKMEAGKFPFTVIPLSDIRKMPQDHEGIQTRRPKSSQLCTFDAHADYILAESLRNDFRRAAALFVDPTDERLRWIYQNAKGGHFAVHYKGVYLCVLVAKRRSFVIGYFFNGASQWFKVETDNRGSIDQAKEIAFQGMKSIDDRMQGLIPAGFTWQS